MTMPATPTIDDIDDIDDVIYDQAIPEPPHFFWFNGVKTAKTPGIFYIKHAELGYQPLHQGWSVSERFDDELGYEAKSLHLAIIGWKSQPFTQLEDKSKVWATVWQKGMKVYTEILCMVKGIDEPLVWVAKGFTGKAITGKGGIIQTYDRGVLREATQARKDKKALNRWAFWLPIATLMDGTKIAYPDTGFGSSYTPPALQFQPNTLPEFIGRDLYIRCGELRKEYDPWFKAKHGNAPAGSVVETDEPLPEDDGVEMDAF